MQTILRIKRLEIYLIKVEKNYNITEKVAKANKENIYYSKLTIIQKNKVLTEEINLRYFIDLLLNSNYYIYQFHGL